MEEVEEDEKQISAECDTHDKGNGSKETTRTAKETSAPSQQGVTTDITVQKCMTTVNRRITWGTRPCFGVHAPPRDSRLGRRWDHRFSSRRKYIITNYYAGTVVVAILK